MSDADGPAGPSEPMHVPEFPLYDMLLGATGPLDGKFPHMRGGYTIWPNGAEVAKAHLRIMAIGNSTSLWNLAPWSRLLGERLRAEGHAVAVYNGAGRGNSSSQEVLRVLRDAPAIGPDVILSLSGICDIGWIQNPREYPYRLKYGRGIEAAALEAGVIGKALHGYPEADASPGRIWCRNQRFMALMAGEMGMAIHTYLQPVMGTGAYDPTPQEQAMYDAKAGVRLKVADRCYGDCVADFYAEVRAIMATDPGAYDHVTDLTDVFDGVPFPAYMDHRHQTPEGVAHLAAAIGDHLGPHLSPPQSSA